MPLDFIYCREYGLQPALFNINYGPSEAQGNPIIIINQSVKNLQVPGNKLIAVERVLYKRCIVLSNFKDYDINTTIYVGKKTDLSFQNVAFDFVNDKWRFRGLSGHSLNNTKFNVYDRPKIKAILNQFLTRNVDEVFNLMYTTIAKSDGLKKFLSILEVVIEYGDEFFKLLEPPVEVPYVDKYPDPKKGLQGGNGSPGNGGGNGDDSKKDNTIYYIAGGVVVLWLWKRRNKKNRKS